VPVFVSVLLAQEPDIALLEIAIWGAVPHTNAFSPALRPFDKPFDKPFDRLRGASGLAGSGCPAAWYVPFLSVRPGGTRFFALRERKKRNTKRR
jgi:hypothetical protein